MPVPVKEFVLTHVIKNVPTLKENEYRYSPVEEHFNVPWKMCFTKKSEHVSFHLYCDKLCTAEKWSIETDFNLLLISVTGKQFTQNLKHCFEKKEDNNYTWGSTQFIKWEDMEKSYLVDGNLIIEAHVKIVKMTGIEKKKLRSFDETSDGCSDVVLNVDDNMFYVSKLFLASQSTYFKAMLLGKFEEAKQTEITLNDIKSDDFHNFLELLYGESPIDENTVEGIAHLADMYDAYTAIRKCEEFLIEISEKTLKEKLQLAKRYNLKNLKSKCLSKIITVAEIRSVLSYDLNEMDPSVVGALLQKSLSLLP